MIIVGNILEELEVVNVIGNADVVVNAVVSLDASNVDPNTLMWGSEKNYEIYKKVNQGILICSVIQSDHIKESVTYLLVEKPRKAFMKFLQIFQAQNHVAIISASSKIAVDVTIGEQVTIGENVVIEHGCVIGNNVVIDHNSVIKRKTIISDNVSIGANNVIGGVGFGYEQNDEGKYELLPHIGNVVLMEGVEIGNNTTIDRAVLGSTIIRENAKVDNLVHIAHGVDIGRNSLIIANAMIAGSVKIEENVWVAPSSSILNKITIGSDAIIGMGCVVLRTVEEKAVVVGNPGKTIKIRK